MSTPPKAPYGDVAYADPGYQKDGKKRYPIDTKEHAQAAWSYINKPANAEPYTPAQLDEVKSKIEAAAKKFGITISDAKSPAAKPDSKNSASAPGAVHEDTPEAVKTDAARSGTSGSTQTETNEVPEPRKVERKMNLEELKARREEIAERLRAMNEEFRDAVLEGDAEREWNGLEAELPEVEKKIEAIEARAARIAKLGERSTRTETGFGAPAFHAKRDVFDMDAVVRMHDKDELRDNAMRAVEQVKFSRSASKEAAQDQVADLLDNVDDAKGTLARRVLLTGSPLYERAFGKAMRACSTAILSGEEQRSMLLGTDADGGYAVPFQLDPSVILTSAGVANPLRAVSRQEQIVGKEWQGVVSAGVSVSRDAEAAEVADDSFTLSQPVVRAERVQGFVPFSVELDQDWGQLRSEITRLLVDARVREEASSFFNGNGTPPAANGIIATLSGNTVTNTNTATFTVADVYAMEEALDLRWRQNAVWMMNRGIQNKVRQFNTSGDGDNALLWTRIGAGVPPQLLEYPQYQASPMAATVATGNKILLFGDFQQFLIVDRVGMNMEFVPQVFGSNGRPTGQRGVYVYWRNNTKVLVDAAFKVFVVH